MVWLRADTRQQGSYVALREQASTDVDPLPAVVTPAAQAVHDVLAAGPPAL